MMKNLADIQTKFVQKKFASISVIFDVTKFVWKFLIAAVLIFSLVFCASSVVFSSKTLAFAEDDNTVKTQQTPDTSFIYDTPIADLAEATVYYDKKTVQVEGEVIGDRIDDEDDPEYCWITLTSLDLNTHTLGIFMKKSDADVIDTYGAYGKKGTRLRVRGTFYLACEQHSGISGLHATNVTATEKGSTSQSEANTWIWIAGAATVFVGLVLIIVYRRVRDDGN